MAPVPRSFRFPSTTEARIAALQRQAGDTATRVLIDAVDRHFAALMPDAPSDFIWTLINDASSERPRIALRVAADGATSVELDGGGQVAARLQVRTLDKGRIAIDLCGIEGDPEFAGVAVPVCTAPAGADFTATVTLEDLVPELRT